MNKKYVALVSLAVLLAACAKPGDQKGEAANQANAVQYIYHCEGGENIVVTYPTPDQAIIRYQGNQYTLQQAVTASGARYLAGDLEWRSKGIGSGGTGYLYRIQDGEETERMLASCSLP